MNDFIVALKAMGYRRPDVARDANRWVKPIGYNVFIAHAKELRLNCHCYAPNNEFMCWESKEMKLDGGTLVSQIASFEQYSNRTANYHYQDFSFLTTEEKVDLVLTGYKK
jgi:hypothetical protein